MLAEITPEQVAWEFGLNTFGVIYMIQAVVDAGKMPRGGRIINLGSIASKQGIPGLALYCGAKAAMDSMTASFAGEVSTMLVSSGVLRGSLLRRSSSARLEESPSTWSRPDLSLQTRQSRSWRMKMDRNPTFRNSFDP